MARPDSRLNERNRGESKYIKFVFLEYTLDIRFMQKITKTAPLYSMNKKNFPSICISQSCNISYKTLMNFNKIFDKFSGFFF